MWLKKSYLECDITFITCYALMGIGLTPQVLAVDRAISGQVNTATAALVVRVGDVEDQPPQFIQAPPVTRIPEDIPVNSGVLEGECFGLVT